MVNNKIIIYNNEEFEILKIYNYENQLSKDLINK